ncbi:ABC-type transport auxiliary lipoprotein family protein [Phenylobacterium sp.]|uniref:ABC-type transport auxiliary lipoprotein family protein n=1 Tax=Phenylobacterium sp. TaxID=1871053 RepID=UPI0035B0F999
MSLARSMVRAAGVALAAAALAACVTVFPKTKPVQLYRFTAPQPAAEAPQGEVTPVGVFKNRTSFSRAVASDRILTMSGSKAAYIADARWVSPASVLFDEALNQAFDDNVGPARLVVRGEASRAAYFLRVEVNGFEADYDHGSRGAPTVLVKLRAVLTRSSDRALIGDVTFDVRTRAKNNRVGSIVEAFDEASGEAIAKLIAWTNEKAVPTKD